jgi:hypothetical protein
MKASGGCRNIKELYYIYGKKGTSGDIITVSNKPSSQLSTPLPMSRQVMAEIDSLAITWKQIHLL